jgi:ABC-type Zn2+ transport system substrate-binding protein/surface adhesin
MHAFPNRQKGYHLGMGRKHPNFSNSALSDPCDIILRQEEEEQDEEEDEEEEDDDKDDTDDDKEEGDGYSACRFSEQKSHHSGVAPWLCPRISFTASAFCLCLATRRGRIAESRLQHAVMSADGHP